MNNEDFVTYEQAKKLKELGFVWETTHYYDDGTEIKEQSIYVGPTAGEGVSISDVIDGGFNKCNSDGAIDAPTLSQVQNWFREVHGIDIDIDSVYHRLDTGNKIMYGLRIGIQKTFQKEFYLNYDSHKEALSKGIDHAIKIIKK